MSAMPWLDELCQAKQAEIDRLRGMIEVERDTGDHWKTESDRLRAENAELKQCADAAITDKFREIAKIERLRAENAELREVMTDIFRKSTGWGSEWSVCRQLLIDIKAMSGAILAKTAKEEK